MSETRKFKVGDIVLDCPCERCVVMGTPQLGIVVGYCNDTNMVVKVQLLISDTPGGYEPNVLRLFTPPEKST